MFGKAEHSTDVRITPLATTFRYETELAAPAEAYFLGHVGPLDFAHELDALRAAPDLVGGRRGSGFERRLRLGPDPVTSVLELRLLEFAQGVSDDELRAWAPWGWRDLKRRALEPALARALIRCKDERWHAVEVSAAYDDLVAVELKLHDWRTGIRQARRNLAFANQSWLVMPAPPKEAAELAQWVGVGLLDVGDATRVVVAAREQAPLAPLASRLFAELVLAQTLGLVEVTPAGSPRGRAALAAA